MYEKTTPQKSFVINDVFFKNMRAFEIYYDLPENTLSYIKKKYKTTAEEAAMRAMELPQVKRHIIYQNSFTAKFLQMSLPTTDFAYYLG
jgi:hypothetical protein